MGVGQTEVVGVLLLALLEYLIGVEGDQAHRVLHTPAVEPRFVTVALVDLHTSVEVDNVLVVDLRIVRSGKTEVVRQHVVVAALVDTALGQDRNRHCIRIVGIGIQERVVVTDHRSSHCTVGAGLIRIVRNVVLLRRSRIFDGGQCAQFETRDGLVTQLRLEFRIHDVEIDVVTPKFVDNVEGSVVARVEFIGIERPGRIHRIRVGVDVEIALYLAEYHVGRRGQRTRSRLLTVRTARNEVQRQIVENIVGSVEVRRITLHLAGLGPSRIEHGAHRSVVLRLLGTGAEADRVRVHQRTPEKFLEPVRVAVLGLTQVAVARSLRIFEFARIYQLPHFAVNTARRGVCDSRVVEPALSGHFLIYRHLILRIHDVEIGIARRHAERIVAGIADAAFACAAFLGRNDDHAGHSARTVYGSCGTVFQNAEALDVVGVETCDGGADQRRGVTRRECVGVDVDHILHNDAVHDPKRFRTAVNRRRTADADLGSGTERTRYVLHRDTGRTAFQTAADIGHTRKFHIVGGKAVRRTRKETFVGLGHTRNHDGLDSLLVRNKGNLHVRTDLHILRNIPQIGDLQFLGFRRNIVHNEKSLLIGGYTDGRTFDDNRSADHGRSVFINDTTAHLFGLGECPRCKHKYSN